MQISLPKNIDYFTTALAKKSSELKEKRKIRNDKTINNKSKQRSGRFCYHDKVFRNNSFTARIPIFNVC